MIVSAIVNWKHTYTAHNTRILSRIELHRKLQLRFLTNRTVILININKDFVSMSFIICCGAGFLWAAVPVHCKIEVDAMKMFHFNVWHLTNVEEVRDLLIVCWRCIWLSSTANRYIYLSSLLSSSLIQCICTLLYILCIFHGSFVFEKCHVYILL